MTSQITTKPPSPPKFFELFDPNGENRLRQCMALAMGEWLICAKPCALVLSRDQHAALRRRHLKSGRLEQPENQGRHHDDDHQKHSRKETDLLLMRRQVSLGRFLSHNFWLITFGCDKEAILRYPKEKEPGQKPKKPDS